MANNPENPESSLTVSVEVDDSTVRQQMQGLRNTLAEVFGQPQAFGAIGGEGGDPAQQGIVVNIGGPAAGQPMQVNIVGPNVGVAMTPGEPLVAQAGQVMQQFILPNASGLAIQGVGEGGEGGGAWGGAGGLDARTMTVGEWVIWAKDKLLAQRGSFPQLNEAGNVNQWTQRAESIIDNVAQIHPDVVVRDLWGIDPRYTAIINLHDAFVYGNFAPNRERGMRTEIAVAESQAAKGYVTTHQIDPSTMMARAGRTHSGVQLGIQEFAEEEFGKEFHLEYGTGITDPATGRKTTKRRIDLAWPPVDIARIIGVEVKSGAAGTKEADQIWSYFTDLIEKYKEAHGGQYPSAGEVSTMSEFKLLTVAAGQKRTWMASLENNIRQLKANIRTVLGPTGTAEQEAVFDAMFGPNGVINKDTFRFFDISDFAREYGRELAESTSEIESQGYFREWIRRPSNVARKDQLRAELNPPTGTPEETEEKQRTSTRNIIFAAYLNQQRYEDITREKYIKNQNLKDLILAELYSDDEGQEEAREAIFAKMDELRVRKGNQWLGRFVRTQGIQDIWQGGMLLDEFVDEIIRMTDPANVTSPAAQAGEGIQNIPQQVGDAQRRQILGGDTGLDMYRGFDFRSTEHQAFSKDEPNWPTDAPPHGIMEEVMRKGGVWAEYLLSQMPEHERNYWEEKRKFLGGSNLEKTDEGWFGQFVKGRDDIDAVTSLDLDEPSISGIFSRFSEALLRTDETNKGGRRISEIIQNAMSGLKETGITGLASARVGSIFEAMRDPDLTTLPEEISLTEKKIAGYDIPTLLKTLYTIETHDVEGVERIFKVPEGADMEDLVGKIRERLFGKETPDGYIKGSIDTMMKNLKDLDTYYLNITPGTHIGVWRYPQRT